MSYYTDYTLDIKDHDDIPEEVHKKITEVSGYEFEDNGLYDATWYEWQRDMVIISKAFPDLFFTLWGNGSTSYDFWVAYIKNGKMQIEDAEIVYPAFDEEKMS